MSLTFKRAALGLNWAIAIILGCAWYAYRPLATQSSSQRPEATEKPRSQTLAMVSATMRAKAEAARKGADLRSTPTNPSKEELHARSNGLLPVALKNPEYRKKLDRWLRITRTRNDVSVLYVLNLPDAKREAFIDLLSNRTVEGLDVQEMTNNDPSVHREMTHQVLTEYQSKIVDLLGEQFQLYNNYVSLGDFRRGTLEPIETRLEMYGAQLTRNQQIDLIDWFTSDRKRQKLPYAALEAWADSGRSNLTVEQILTLRPVLQDFASLDPKHN